MRKYLDHPPWSSSTKVVRQGHKYPDRRILVRQLEENPFHIRVYTNGSFADNADLSTQTGFIVLLCYKNGRCNILHCNTHNPCRVERSVLGGEIFAFSDRMDFALNVKSDLERILDCKLQFSMFTESKSLFDLIAKNMTSTEKRLMVDVHAAREAYARFQIISNAWIRSQFNPADALAKVKENSVLNKIIDNVTVDHPL